VTTLLVVAKEPKPGKAKTRLSPPCTPEEAATLAAAALADTFDAVLHTPADRRVVVLDGRPGPWIPAAFEVLPQRNTPFAQRLAGAFADTIGDGPEPTLLVGMDTPQVPPSMLASALDSLARADAALGLARDGGWWALGLHRADDRVFAGIPMSTDQTGRRQRERLAALGYRVALLPECRDVDTWDDACAVADEAPHTRFARTVAARRAGLGTA
jgi:hypothetical protein